MGRVLGADISKYQKEIDWPVLARRLAFVCIRATQGRSYVDHTFKSNWAGADRAGVIRGAYHVIELDHPIEKQVDSYLSTVGSGISESLPPVLDVETKKIKEVDSKEAAAGVKRWLEICELKCGRRPILYISERGVRNLRKGGDVRWLSGYRLWAVKYVIGGLANAIDIDPELPQNWSTWTFWQFTSKAHGPSYGAESERIDLDFFNGSAEDLRRLTGNTPTLYLSDESAREAVEYNIDNNTKADLEKLVCLLGLSPWNTTLENTRIVSRWQLDHGLTPDGKVGAKTLAALAK